MKRIFTLLVALAICLSACSVSNSDNSSSVAPSSSFPIRFRPETSSTPSESISPPTEWLTYTTPLQPFETPENWQGEHPLGLVGGWHDDTMLGALFGTRYLFLEDGTFHFIPSEYSEDERVRYMSGAWRYDGSGIELIVTHKIVIEGGELVNNSGGGNRANWIENGELVKYTFSIDEYEHVALPLQIWSLDEIPEATSNTMGVIDLDSKRLYWVASIGYDEMLTYWDTYPSERGLPIREVIN